MAQPAPVNGTPTQQPVPINGEVVHQPAPVNGGMSFESQLAAQSVQPRSTVEPVRAAAIDVLPNSESASALTAPLASLLPPHMPEYRAEPNGSAQSPNGG